MIWFIKGKRWSKPACSFMGSNYRLDLILRLGENCHQVFVINSISRLNHWGDRFKEEQCEALIRPIQNLHLLWFYCWSIQGRCALEHFVLLSLRPWITATVFMATFIMKRSQSSKAACVHHSTSSITESRCDVLFWKAVLAVRQKRDTQKRFHSLWSAVRWLWNSPCTFHSSWSSIYIFFLLLIHNFIIQKCSLYLLRLL